MNNMPKTKIGIVAVSRDCFPESLSVTRREALIKAYKEKYDPEAVSYTHLTLPTICSV